MDIYLDCIPCFFKQALEAAKLAGANEKTQKKILNELAKALPKFPLTSSPSEMGRIIYGLVKKITKKEDPYLKIKRKSNALSMSIYPRLKDKISCSDDRLLTAVELAIAGNIIDYGVKNSLNVDKELKRILEEEERIIEEEDRKSFNYLNFKHAAEKARSILYLADNAGEVVFDRVLIEEIKSFDLGKGIIYAVKESPIINDALMADAITCGIDKVARIISSGSDAPGTVLSFCSKKFLKIYKNVDMVISKGQGNFEALSRPGRSVFFLFMAKCPVVAKNVHCNVGDIVLLHKKNKKK